jgi:hypothetical protein
MMALARCHFSYNHAYLSRVNIVSIFHRGLILYIALAYIMALKFICLRLYKLN